MTLTAIPTVSMPILALRGMTVFPNMLLHFDVARAQSVKALDHAVGQGSSIFLIPQRDLSVDEPKGNDLYSIGVICGIRQVLRLPGGSVRVLVEGKKRGRIAALTRTEPFLQGEIQEITPLKARMSSRAEALIRRSYDIYQRYAELTPTSPETLLSILSSDDPGEIADAIAQNSSMRMEDKQEILEELRPVRRLEKLCRLLRREIEILVLESDIEGKTRDGLERTQREYYLRQQLRVIEDELGEGEDSELGEYRERIAKAKLPKEIEERLLKELERLGKQPYASAEASVSRNYLDVCLELPWGKYTKERLDVAATRKALDRDHYGLGKVKERILEYVAVRRLAPDLKGQILCLVGAPGVGKTSVAQSVAKALNRKLARVSLGGVHDEAEIRGHRKTYVGAMPGRIITGIRQAGSCNPVLVLDEIDKLGHDGRSDPSSALLEVLDPEQNGTFRDNFLEIPFDLSQVLFITTANTTDTIPRPLLDRMEVIELPSYTDEEKLHIAKEYLLPQELGRHGLKRAQFKLTDDAMRTVIAAYTRESGVRLLRRRLAKLSRKAAMEIVEKGVKGVTVTPENLESYLGGRKYHRDAQVLERRVGVVNGLAWTETGGELLEVEVNVMPGSGKLELTGNLGDVMKESARAALSYLRSHAETLGLDPDFYKKTDLHVHFPEGAIPKDGPSAGIAVTTAMASALTGRAVRPGIAMTGEVTLRGRVLPIGGLREKTMAALRAGIHQVVIPVENEKDLEEIDQSVREKLCFLPVAEVDQVLEQALEAPTAPAEPRPRTNLPYGATPALEPSMAPQPGLCQ